MKANKQIDCDRETRFAASPARHLRRYVIDHILSAHGRNVIEYLILLH